MGEPQQIIFTYREVVEALIRKQGLRSGRWALLIKFGLKAGNFGENKDSLVPSAMVGILGIGLRKDDQDNNISVDAGQVNPAKPPRLRSVSKKKSPKTGG